MNCGCSDRMALWEAQRGPAHSSPGLPEPPHLSGTFRKSPFRLGPNCPLSNRLVCDGAGEKEKALHAMGGHPERELTP